MLSRKYNTKVFWTPICLSVNKKTSKEPNLRIEQSYSGLAQKDFSASVTTSSGDKIELSLSQSDEMQYSQNENSTTLSIRHKERLHYRLESNGLSEQDRKEIDEAMQKINPKLQEFFALGGADKQPLSSTARDIAQTLPEKITDEGKSYIFDALNKQLSQLQKLFDTQNGFEDDAKGLLDRIMRQMDTKKNEIYA